MTGWGCPRSCSGCVARLDVDAVEPAQAAAVSRPARTATLCPLCASPLALELPVQSELTLSSPPPRVLAPPAGDLPNFTDSLLLCCCVAELKGGMDAEGHSTDSVARSSMEPKAAITSTSIGFIESTRELLLDVQGIGGRIGHVSIALPSGTRRHQEGYDGSGQRLRSPPTAPPDQTAVLASLQAHLVRVATLVGWAVAAAHGWFVLY